MRATSHTPNCGRRHRLHHLSSFSCLHRRFRSSYSKRQKYTREPAICARWPIEEESAVCKSKGGKPEDAGREEYGGEEGTAGGLKMHFFLKTPLGCFMGFLRGALICFSLSIYIEWLIKRNKTWHTCVCRH